MSTELISVIVPVYNVELYLRRCLDSIISQTYKNLEIILVDDGSPDNSPKICDEYASIDNRIIVIHKENGGLSSARNAGLSVAKGRYISFVDSDDYLYPNAYEEYIKIMKNGCDIVEAYRDILSDKGYIVKNGEKEPYYLNGKEALKLQLMDCNDAPRIAVWSKLFKKEFWEHRRFPEGKIHEDYMLTCEALYLADKVGFVGKALYCYYVNPLSITHKGFSKKDLFLEEQYHNRYQFLLDKNEFELANYALLKYYKILLYLFQNCHKKHYPEEKKYIELLKLFRQNILSANLSKRDKNKFKLFFLSRNIYYSVWRLNDCLQSKEARY